MSARILLTGDINLMNVTNPDVPFRNIAADLQAADVVFGNLECCLHLPSGRSTSTEGFFADPTVGGEALARAGIHAVGIANNVNYGAANIMASIARLDALDILHTGAGCDLAAARAPAVIARNGVRVGVLQRSSVYWPTDHEAHEDSPGIAVLRGHTAYQVPAGRMQAGIPPANRPGVPPVIMTWADAHDLEELGKDLHALRSQVDIVVASCHWGLGREPLAYMSEIAPMRQSRQAPTSSSATVRIIRCRSSSTAAGPSFTVSAICPSTPATADANTRTGSGLWSSLR